MAWRPDGRSISGIHLEFPRGKLIGYITLEGLGKVRLDLTRSQRPWRAFSRKWSTARTASQRDRELVGLHTGELLDLYLRPFGPGRKLLYLEYYEDSFGRIVWEIPL